MKSLPPYVLIHSSQMESLTGLFRLGLVYTSETIQGQVYIPMVNWTCEFSLIQLSLGRSDLSIVMIAVIVVVAAFKDLAAMTNAYGYALLSVYSYTAY
jgi:KUP system potassium uptake protein